CQGMGCGSLAVVAIPTEVSLGDAGVGEVMAYSDGAWATERAGRANLTRMAAISPEPRYVFAAERWVHATVPEIGRKPTLARLREETKRSTAQLSGGCSEHAKWPPSRRRLSSPCPAWALNRRTRRPRHLVWNGPAMAPCAACSSGIPHSLST